MVGPRNFYNNIVMYKIDISGMSSIVAEYFESHKTISGDYINSTTVIFSKGFAIPPNGQPAPTADNFDFYINGILIERIAIVSFINNINSSTLTIDPEILDFSFESSDKILAIGKFN